MSSTSPHDLRLSAWGPYTRRYIGVSHIADPGRGLRFDLSVFPGLYRRSVNLPHALWDCGHHPWEATPDLAYYSYRHELIWRDQLYCDIAFCRLDEQAVLVHCTAVNQSDAPQQLALHMLASLHFPPVEPYHDTVLQPAAVSLPPTAQWINALDYAALHLRRADPRAYLPWDGHTRGEVRAHGFVDGLGLGDGFGSNPGDSVTYTITLSQPLPDAVLLLRARVPADAAATLAVNGVPLLCAGTGDLACYPCALGMLPAGPLTITLTARAACPMELDGFALVPAADAPHVTFAPAPWQPGRPLGPTLTPGPHPDRTLLLQYAHIPHVYGLAWGHQPAQVREFYAANLDSFMRRKVHEHVAHILTEDSHQPGNGYQPGNSYQPEKGHATNVVMQPLFLAPQSSQVITGLVCAGDAAAVAARLAAFDPTPAAWESTRTTARRGLPNLTPNPSGRIYTFSQQRMAATLATNIIYPIRSRGAWIRAYVPGRWWDCLYTWDAGFIGLGLLELGETAGANRGAERDTKRDTERATDILHAYLTPPDDPQAAFIHHGSPLLTQFNLYAECWNRAQDRAMLAHFFPRLRQALRFLLGRAPSSTMRTLRTPTGGRGLLRTWDYFYNSGGWDDYPPQVYSRDHGLYPRVAPVVNTAHAIRYAKILRAAAQTLGEATAEFDRDIADLTAALQHAWDDDAGYFSYLLHDDRGQPAGFLRDDHGVNYNMGLDGASPLIADVCTPAQRARLLHHLTTPGRLWTASGIATVDQTAPYARDDGYWNGAVWMAHQWFFWKALLDLGQTDAAYRLAQTALDLWQTEVDRTYNCPEHFVIATGRGAGWHCFGALSAPVLAWYSAYHRPGRITGGHNLWIESLAVESDARSLTATLRIASQPDTTPALIATLAPDTDYLVTWQGAPIPATTRHAGTLEFHLPPGSIHGTLHIQPRPTPV